ncbi:MAG: AraC family transcriptional regulator [Bacteroidales bacterium]|nr:AraC family transcriptional regulator [Bacteroidales bacterium]
MFLPRTKQVNQKAGPSPCFRVCFRQNAGGLFLQTPPPDKKLFEIADDLNFPSAPSFTAFFKRETGMTPSQYRNGQSPVPED